MNTKYPHLLSPIRLGSVTFRHRMFSAPMGATDITFDCSPGPRTQGFYELRAKGGSGGRLFGSITSQEVSDALKEQYNITIDKKKIVQDEPIKSYGTFNMKAKLGYEINATITVHVSEP